MFRLVALISFAILLVRNKILLMNKQMICRHLTFTFKEHPHRVFKKDRPSGVPSSPKLLLSLHLHLRISQGPTCPDGVERTSTNIFLFHTPTPLKGCMKMLNPWRNSYFEFILMSGSRFAILTPTFAFLLCGLEKN